MRLTTPPPTAAPKAAPQLSKVATGSPTRMKRNCGTAKQSLTACRHLLTAKMAPMAVTARTGATVRTSTPPAMLLRWHRQPRLVVCNSNRYLPVRQAGLRAWVASLMVTQLLRSA